jgi:hypothetical protein
MRMMISKFLYPPSTLDGSLVCSGTSMTPASEIGIDSLLDANVVGPIIGCIAIGHTDR